MQIPNRPPDRINEHGNHIYDASVSWDRYKYDFNLCSPNEGWSQYDTDQDAWYFGVWVNLQERLIVTFAEGDEIICYCPTSEGFKAELKAMSDFYGPPPPAFVCIDDNGVTYHFDPDARPEI